MLEILKNTCVCIVLAELVISIGLVIILTYLRRRREFNTALTVLRRNYNDPDYPAIVNCPDCGRFRGHGHVCGPDDRKAGAL